jgi:hypothetical protein
MPESNGTPLLRAGCARAAERDSPEALVRIRSFTRPMRRYRLPSRPRNYPECEVVHSCFGRLALNVTVS